MTVRSMHDRETRLAVANDAARLAVENAAEDYARVAVEEYGDLNDFPEANAQHELAARFYVAVFERAYTQRWQELEGGARTSHPLLSRDSRTRRANA